MNRRIFLIATFVFVHPILAGAKPSSPTREEVLTAMEKATEFMLSISTEGGYLFNYSPDLKVRAGKDYASPTQIWIQPPGTPAMGKAFLNAYAVTGNPLYLEAARRAAEALAKCQLPSGGWSYSGDFNPKYPNKDGTLSYQGERASTGKNPDNPHYRAASTFEDNVTQGPILFLMDFLDAVGTSKDPRDEALRASRDRALEGMIKAQYPNGAWPERYDGKPRHPSDYPIRKATIPADYPRTWPGADYTPFYTINNDTQRDCVLVLLDAYRRYGQPEYLEAAKRGADFILLAQFPEPQPGWAQQYDFAMNPAWGRVMELPAIASVETRSALDILLEMYLETGEEKYLEAISPALAWLKRSAIGEDLWARSYELKTNKPVYGGYDGKIHYDMKDKDVRKGYSWQGSFKIPEFVAAYDRIRTEGRESWLAREKSLRAKQSAGAPGTKAERLLRRSHIRSQHDTPATISDSQAAQIISDLDEQGRWITKAHFRKFSENVDLISVETYIKNLDLLGQYLKSLPSTSSHKEETSR